MPKKEVSTEKLLARFQSVLSSLIQTFEDLTKHLKEQKNCDLDEERTSFLEDFFSGVDGLVIEDKHVKRYNRGYKAGYECLEDRGLTEEYHRGYLDGRKQSEHEQLGYKETKENLSMGQQKNKSWKRGYAAGYNGKKYNGKTESYSEGFEQGRLWRKNETPNLFIF